MATMAGSTDSSPRIATCRSTIWGYVVLLNSTNSGRAVEGLNPPAIDFLSKIFPAEAGSHHILLRGSSRNMPDTTLRRARGKPAAGVFWRPAGGTRIRVINRAN